MDKTCRSDIATFPELFGEIEQFIDEFGAGFRRTSLRLAIVAVPSCSLLLFALNKAA